MATRSTIEWRGARTGGAVLAWCALALLEGCAPEHSLEVTATAYNSTRAQTDARPGEAAWGTKLEPGMRVIAVSPDLVAAGLVEGTRVEVEGLPGTWVVRDRTASRYRKRIDIYMGTDVAAARQWGVRRVIIRWSP
jgi:3D (Asp-Asp-Asp) domain-containing protein